ncbi:hypothetical protein [Arthrobacter bambusae]|uniref:Uncharacterized protein n=1 Tax=Arthrobacter bambusae TaxID=1338426 RepID=A0AAW8DAE4_9MICC|nr:hypothetical protein [Arthrobacter bambusae]MDP9904700.1 hypothetical protein [Arthrobacter bambusae]MDQ0129516.1 hypothetical protein [Arthrobacter bambusae]MDQ0180871.1 hypothetical protein [Arthrobacter bambusae]
MTITADRMKLLTTDGLNRLLAVAVSINDDQADALLGLNEKHKGHGCRYRHTGSGYILAEYTRPENTRAAYMVGPSGEQRPLD